MVREAFRVLKPGGTLSIYTPNPTHMIERMKARNLLKQNPTHIDLKTKERLLATLEAANFRPRLAYFTPSFFPVFNLIERVMMPFPLVGPLFRYRICISVVKPNENRIGG